MNEPTKPSSSTPSQSGRLMEKAMLGMTGVFLLGVVIYGFVPPGPARSIGMTLFIGVLVYYIFNPLGAKKASSSKSS